VPPESAAPNPAAAAPSKKVVAGDRPRRLDRLGGGRRAGLEAGDNPRTTDYSRAASSEFARAVADLVGKRIG